MTALNRLITFAGTALVAGALGLSAVATAGTAGALSSVDDTFISGLDAEGIAYDSPKDAILAAHSLCSALDDGADPVDLGMKLLHSSDLTTDQVAAFVVTAVDSYCPTYSGYFE
jgi:hypothetical protein